MKGKKILIVEDDERQRLLYREELTMEGYTIIEASSAPEALEKARSERPDLVLLDISLPGMDGLEALARIHDQDRKLPIILHTAYASYQDHFISWLADAYVIKSSNLDELKEKVREMLGGGTGASDVFPES